MAGMQLAVTLRMRSMASFKSPLAICILPDEARVLLVVTRLSALQFFLGSASAKV